MVIPALTKCHLSLVGQKPISYLRDPVTLGDLLKNKRIDLSLTQGQVADEIGTSISNIRKWETNRRQVSLQFRKKACEFIGFSPFNVSLPLVLRFKERREYLGISNKEAAWIFGVDVHTISNWEVGIHWPSAENIKKIELFLRTRN